MFELKDCNKFYGRAVEGDEPDAKDLKEGYVDEEVRFVKRNRLYRELNLGAHDFVPSIYGLDKVSRILPASCPAEGMCERRIGHKVDVNRFPLDRGRRLGEGVDHAWYFLDWVFHIVESFTFWMRCCCVIPDLLGRSCDFEAWSFHMFRRDVILVLPISCMLH